MSAPSAVWQITAERAEEYVAKGHQRRRFFPHRVYHLPKCGPDGFRLAQDMCGKENPSSMWEIVLFADPAMLAEFPEQLFFDDDVFWHRQQFGLPGQVATASVILDRRTVYSITHVSDLVQRISRRREHKTRIEKRFGGWCHMLLNSVLAFAAARGARRVRTPTATLARRHTDRARLPGFGVFDRIYDRTVMDLYPARRDGEWWVVEVADARGRILMPERRIEVNPSVKTVCICHDIERGMGGVDGDPALAGRAERDLAATRQVEAEIGAKATYVVAGSLLPEVREALARDGHALGFRSFDHGLSCREQVRRCREVDHRIKGYRPPRTRIRREAWGRNLLLYNFEWLASSRRPERASSPRMHAGLVRLPITLDDSPLYRGLPYGDWERLALQHIADSDFAAIGLHDSNAPRRLPDYRRFLERVGEIAELRTLDEVAAEVTLRSAS